jgi:hypothetical protein
MVFDNPVPPASPSVPAGSTSATRLVQVLLRKGVLTQAEAREILSEDID